MHLVLLGNGYDLSYHLPTSYRNFLLTIKFILTHPFDDIHTIGDIFGHKDLTSQDQFINESFEEYKDTYNSIAINLSDLNTLKRLAQNNIWYEYFLNTFNKCKKRFHAPTCTVFRSHRAGRVTHFIKSA